MISFVQSLDLQVFTPLGYRITGTFFSPSISTHRTIILYPPPKRGMDFFLQESPIHWKKWFLLGCNVLLFDPLGCGSSWGGVDWGGIEAQAGLKALLDWLKIRKEQNILIVSFGASVIGTICALDEHPVIAFDALYHPEEMIKKYPELLKKTDYFWKERRVRQEDIQKISFLPQTPTSFRERLYRRSVLFQKTLRHL